MRERDNNTNLSQRGYGEQRGVCDIMKESENNKNSSPVREDMMNRKECLTSCEGERPREN